MPWGLAAGAVSAVGDIAGGIMGGNAAQSAANSQVNASNNAINAANVYGNYSQNVLAPYAQAGTNALGAYQAALGIGAGGTGAINPAQFQASPGYQFQMTQGIDAIQNSAAAKGGVMGGNTLKALQTYGTGLADQSWQQYLAQLAGVAGSGQQAATQQGQFSQATGNAIGSDYLGIGNAQAAGTIGQSNAMAAGFNGAGQNLLGAYFQSGFGSGGSGGLASGNYGNLSPYVYTGPTNPGMSLAPGQYNF